MNAERRTCACVSSRLKSRASFAFQRESAVSHQPSAASKTNLVTAPDSLRLRLEKQRWVEWEIINAVWQWLPTQFEDLKFR